MPWNNTVDAPHAITLGERGCCGAANASIFGQEFADAFSDGDEVCLDCADQYAFDGSGDGAVQHSWDTGNFCRITHELSADFEAHTTRGEYVAIHAVGLDCAGEGMNVGAPIHGKTRWAPGGVVGPFEHGLVDEGACDGGNVTASDPFVDEFDGSVGSFFAVDGANGADVREMFGQLVDAVSVGDKDEFACVGQRDVGFDFHESNGISLAELRKTISEVRACFRQGTLGIENQPHPGSPIEQA